MREGHTEILAEVVEPHRARRYHGVARPGVQEDRIVLRHNEAVSDSRRRTGPTDPAVPMVIALKR
jgi:hypothetical protein